VWDDVTTTHQNDTWLTVIPFRLPKPDTEDCICYEGKVHDCPDCKCECPDCDGTGVVTKQQIVSYGNETMDGKYAAMILALPNRRVSGAHSGHMLFSCDEGDGILRLMCGGYGLNDAIADLITGLK
jgi:hypothetical protein